MKYWIGLVLLVSLVGSQTGCVKNACTEFVQMTVAEPVFLDEIDFRKNPEWLAPRPLVKPGKIFTYGNFLLISEYLEGIHIYDNSSPANTVSLGFLAIPGNVDLAFNGQYLYADAYTDLLTIKFSSPADFSLVNRREGVFNDAFSQWDNRVVAYYNTRDTTMEVNCLDRRRGWFYADGGLIAFDQVGVNGRVGSSTDFGSSAPAKGQGGSLARFALVGSYLYTVNDQSLFTFGLQPDGSAQLITSQEVGFGIETIFPFRDFLFLGSSDGLYIININNPSNPILTSRFDHARACDPVVVDGDLAYVTLRSGTTCPGGENRLEIVNVADVYNPYLFSFHPMVHPHGLGKTEDLLFICEGEHGLKVFDASDPQRVGANKLAEYKGITAYDVIALSRQNIIVTGPGGVYQFHFSDENELRLLSRIGIQ
jgi:hypothetical protein